MHAQQSWSSQTAGLACVSGCEQTLPRGRRRTANLNSDWLMVSAAETVHPHSHWSAANLRQFLAQ